MSTQERVLLAGEAGRMEVFIDLPEGAPTAIAIIGHPHPVLGGDAEHKVVTTLARTLRDLGCVALRPNFRGAGASEGVHDDGIGETRDFISVYAYAYHRFGNLPLYLVGFSFGCYIISRVAKALIEGGTPAKRLLMVAPVAGFLDGTRSYQCENVPADTLVIHGSADDVVPLANVLAWAEPQDLPVSVVAGANHMFDRRQHVIRNLVSAALR